MAFTKIVAAGINTGSSYTFQDLNTVGVVTAATVQVGSATTVHTTGIDLGSGNITSHNINSTGIITATSLVGPVTGNLTGNVTATTGSFSGDVSIGGTLTYEDVTNIDSVGIITAQAGIRVTGGSVGIGTNNPSSTFVVRGDDLTKAIKFQTNTSTQSSMLFQNSTTGYGSNDGLYFGIDQEEDGYLWHFESENLIFGTSNTERLRIDSSGRVLQGLTSAKFGFFNDGNAPPVFQIQGDTYYDSALSIFRDGTGASGPNFILAKGRGAIVQDNDILGTISFQGHDGTTELIEGTSIVTEVDGTPAANNVPSALVFKTNSGTSSTTEKLRITSGGDVSIGGLASPRAKLDIEDAGTSKDVILRVSADDINPYALVVANDTFNTTSNRGFAFWVGSDKVHHIEARTSTTNSENEIMVSAGDAITFRTNVSEERLRIDSSGRLLKSGQASLTSTSLSHSIQVAAASDANAIAIIGRNGDDIGELSFYEADKSTKLGELQYRQDHVNIRHRVGDIRFATGGTSVKLSLNSDGKLILSSTQRTTPFISGDGGMCIEQSYDGNLRALTIRNKHTDAAAATSLAFSLNRSGSDHDFASGEIKSVKEQTWSGVPTTVDSAMVFSTIQNENLGEKLRIKSDGEVQITNGKIKLGTTNGTDSIIHTDNAAGIIYRADANGHRFQSWYSSSWQDNMTIQDNGIVVKQQHPAFRVTRNIANWNVSAGSKFDWDTVVFNTGSHFSTANDRFVAPVAGTYHFDFSIIWYHETLTNEWVSLRVNNSRVTGGDIHFSANFSASRWHNVAFSHTVYLASSDYVEMWNGGNTVNYHGSTWAQFSGHLVG